MSHQVTSSEVMQVVFQKVFATSRKALGEIALDKGTLQLGRDFGLDSLDSMQLCLELESHFGVELEDSTSWKSLQDVVDSVDSALAARGN